MPRTTQLRTYTVREGMLDEWVERWRAEIVPLRRGLGFTIGGAWADRERSRFVWLISYDGPETFAERNALYWASPERKAMNLDPDDYLVHTDDRTVETVDLEW
ncbi:NIPSNAP family protein [Streptomyces aculeolatus]